MSNMSYCRFRNTLTDLRDCSEHLQDIDSKEEFKARQKLIDLCREIVNDADNLDLDNEKFTDVSK